ncbi:hypothetical protein EDD17DRAFT_1545048 [Pisolithus thermaeus]|nr:hypothetical protein EDD17DRAFT_1545048 [Pisolithus thermaeus]
MTDWQESAHQEALALRSFVTWLAHFAFFAPGLLFHCTARAANLLPLLYVGISYWSFLG